MSPRLAKVFIAALIFGFTSCDQENDVESFDGRTISKVEIQYVGKNTFDENRLRYLIAVKAGDKYSDELLDTAIKTIFESGVVDDVTLFAKPDGEKVIVIAKLKTRPPMEPSNFIIGNTVFSDQKLAREGGLTSDEPITVQALEKARLKLKAFYENNGYTDVEVICRPFSEDEPNLEDFVFVIEEGTQHPQPQSPTDH